MIKPRIDFSLDRPCSNLQMARLAVQFGFLIVIDEGDQKAQTRGNAISQGKSLLLAMLICLLELSEVVLHLLLRLRVSHDPRSSAFNLATGSCVSPPSLAHVCATNAARPRGSVPRFGEMRRLWRSPAHAGRSRFTRSDELTASSATFW